jgi:colanic acid biosynthesis glycosyl transferase WcaI
LRVLLLNQTFHPDVMATAQYASDMARKLVECGHSVTVLTGRRAYDDVSLKFPVKEIWNGVQVIRIPSLGFGKTARWRRAVDFGSFLVSCLVRLAFLPRADIVIALTSPPLVSTLGALFAQVKGGSFVYWVMDLNPDQAIAAGWLRKESWTGRLLSRVLLYSLDRAERIVALDRFMRKRIINKGVPADKVAIIPPWSHDEAVRYDEAGREAFRKEHGLAGKYVVMYSGNHSPCHPLHTLLEAARELRDRADVAFCFVGGGSEFRKVQNFAAWHDLLNIHCLPYQPLERLSASLSAADLHVVVMGDPFVGIVHPCKVYNIVALGIPWMYVGPAPSHVTELGAGGHFSHGDVSGAAGFISGMPRRELEGEVKDVPCTQDALMTRMVEVIESAAEAGDLVVVGSSSAV